MRHLSDKPTQNDIAIDKFLLHIDNILDIILNAYQLPLFVLGTEKISGHFKEFTKHTTAVLEFIPGNYEEISMGKLKEILMPYIDNWKKMKEKNLLTQLQVAPVQNKLAKGISEVWREAMCRKGRLLVI